MTTPTVDAAKDAAKEAAKIPTGILDFLIKPATLSADALNAVAKGGLNFGNVLPAVGAELTNLGSIGGLAGKGLKIFGEYAQESVDAMRNFSKVGAGFSGDAIGMRASIAQTNMSLEQYGKFLNTNSVLLTAMGGSVSKGATAFNTFSADFFAATGAAEKGLGTFGDQLRNLGMNSEEINGVLALELTSRRFTNMQDTANRESAIESARALAEEMDKTSKLSGKSREEQQKSLAALERDGKYQSAIRLEMMNGNKFAAEGMFSAMSKLDKFGPGVQNLAKDIVSFGTASKDTAATLSALGPAGTQLQNAVNMTKTARTEEQKAAAAKAVADAEIAIQVRLSSRDFNEMSRLGIKGATDIATQTTTLTAGLEKVAAENNLNLNIESDRIEANRRRDDEIKKAQDAAKTTAKPGDKDQGKATTQMVIQFESSLQKASAAINEQFIKRLNTEVADEMNSLMLKLRGMPDQSYAQTVEKMYNKVSKSFRDPAAVEPVTAVGNAEAIRAKGEQAAIAAREAAKTAGFNKENQDKQAEIARKKAEAEEKEKQTQRSTPANNPLSSARGGSASDPVYVRQVGPVAVNARPMAIGGIVEKPELILAGEAGPEAIFNQSQLENYTAKVMGSAAGATPKIDLSGISKSISTSISSVSGGGSTTNRRVQSDDSKAAEKELASVQEQMQAERNVLRQKLKDTIGDGSKSGGNAVAKEMRIGDESKAIADKYNAIMEPLKKQINAGISSETVREEAKAETIKIIDEQIAITKTGNSTLADVYRNNSKSKLSAAKQDAESLDDMYKDDSKAKLDLAKQRNEALFKAAELAKDVVGTSVKDMSDSVFESMIPKGAKIEDYYEDMNGKLQSYSADTVAKLEKIAKDSANVVESYSTTTLSSSKKITGNIVGAPPKPEELNALMPKPEEISGIFSNLFKTVPKLAATAEQKVDPNQADNDDAEMGAAIRANDVAGKLISAAPVEIDNPEASMGAGKYSPVKPNATPVAGKDPFARMLDRFMGPMAEPGKALASAEAAKTAITTQNEAAAKADAAREEAKFKQKANQSGASQSQDPKTDKPITGSKESTLSDVVKSLDTLNMQVGQLAGTMSQLPYLMEKSVSATKSLNGNLNARVT